MRLTQAADSGITKFARPIGMAQCIPTQIYSSNRFGHYKIHQTCWNGTVYPYPDLWKRERHLVAFVQTIQNGYSVTVQYMVLTLQCSLPMWKVLLPCKNYCLLITYLSPRYKPHNATISSTRLWKGLHSSTDMVLRILISSQPILLLTLHWSSCILLTLAWPTRSMGQRIQFLDSERWSSELHPKLKTMAMCTAWFVQICGCWRAHPNCSSSLAQGTNSKQWSRGDLCPVAEHGSFKVTPTGWHPF